ncbi:hypothetical protein [Arabiibacter massiliensis]|uniref:hypothetical protein n=1 Tax=Arabiibacter massiliensis TaxID=1870985 RepID=UPI0009B94426|nr:hypothetical protein [Arabiibacter massiliensis]
MAGDARASVLNPLLVGERELVVRWGSYFCERIPLTAVASAGAAECDAGVPKAERLNMAAMGAQPCWIEFARPVETATITGGKRSVRWLCVSPDDAAGFKRAVLSSRADPTARRA